MNTARTHTDTIETTEAPSASPLARGILVVDDHELVRLGFRALVQSQSSSAGQPSIVVFEADTLAQALKLYDAHHSEIAVVLLDLNLPDSSGLDGLMAFRQRFPASTIVVLSGTDNQQLIRNVLSLGAVSFFSKSGNLGEMVGFVHACVLHGPEAAKRLPSRPATTFADFPGAGRSHDFAPVAGQSLSTRQLQILQWLLEGKSNREIGQLACLTEGTVKNHVSTLLLSFGVRSRAQLISKLRA